MVNVKSRSSELLETLQKECGDMLQDSVIELGDVVVTVTPGNLLKLLSACKNSSVLAFNFLSDITAVDWMDLRDDRFEVVYQLLSLSKVWRMTVKVAVSESDPEVASAVPLWAGANFLEREVWDMFGIRFKGHPDLRRILMYEEFVGHPLRKDYPVQGKQPRIPLRAPEVENTARRMSRPDLVTIRSRSRSQVTDSQGAASQGAEGQGTTK
jgi:NADH-quinone oxidoreductase subunit C